MDRRIAFMASLGYAGMEPQQVCESLARLGYQGVEWTSAHFNPRTRSRKQLAGLVQAARAHGLEVSEAGVQQDLVCLDKAAHEERTALILEGIAAAAACGISTLNLFTGPAAWDPQAPKLGAGIREGAAWDLVFGAFERFVEAAEKHKVHLAVEGVFGMLCHGYYTTRVLIDKFPSPFLGVNYDPSHDVLYGHEDVAWTIRQWGSKIKHVHLKDAVGVPELGKFVFPLLGEGRVNWQEFATALDSIGYQGFLSVEFESFAYYDRVLQRDPQAAAELSLQQVKCLLG
jgi:sugar phosphate isomerase/epimerase